MKAAIKYCREHGILSTFLEEHSSEVFNMLITEWNTEEAKEVWFEEGVEKGIEKGILTAAQNALAKGFSVEAIQDITGLDVETIKNLSKP